MKILIFLLFFVAILWICSFCLKETVKKKKNNVEEAYLQVEEFENKKYELIPELINSLGVQNDLTQNILELRQAYIEVKNEYSNIDRKVRLDYVITAKIDELLDSCQISNDYVSKYFEIENEISLYANKYNHCAKILRKAVDTFPQSFFARLLEIKYTDLMKKYLSDS